MCRAVGDFCSHGCANIPDKPGYACTCPLDKVLNNDTGQCEGIGLTYFIQGFVDVFVILSID